MALRHRRDLLKLVGKDAWARCGDEPAAAHELTRDQGAARVVELDRLVRMDDPQRIVIWRRH